MSCKDCIKETVCRHFVDEMALDDVYFTIDEAEKAQERIKGND